jgi:WD40 repeat protein
MAPAGTPLIDDPARQVAQAYDAFLSYRSQSDYRNARWLETFLEGMHQMPAPGGVPIRPLSICRDGSDFRLPRRVDVADGNARVWEIIRQELERSRCLLVLCSPGAVDSRWIRDEVTWFVRHRRENILLVLTEAVDPIGRPDQCFPPVVLEHGLHEARLWYDLRGRRRRLSTAVGVRDWEDEAVRLAADLLDWDAAARGPLWGVYEREQLRVRRRQASWLTTIALVVLAVAIAAGWYALRASREAERARANSVVAAAMAVPDPLTAALMLLELEEEPRGGLAAARSIAAHPLAAAELRGPQSGIAFVEVMPGGTEVAAAAIDGSVYLWNRSGFGEPRTASVRTRGRPVGLAVSRDGTFVASATREHHAIIWSPADNRSWSFQVPALIESIRYISGRDGSVALAISDEGTIFALRPDEEVRPWMPSLRPMGIVASGPSGRLLAAARDGQIWEAAADTAGLQTTGSTPAAADDFPFNGERYAAFSPDGRWYALAFQDRLLLRAVRQPGRVHVIPRPSSICCLDFSPDSRYLAAGGSDGVTTVWRVEDGVAAGEFDSRIKFWQVNAGIPSGDAPEGFSVQSLAFSPGDPQTLAVLTSDSIVRVWRVGGGNPQELRGHIGADSMAWAADGSFLVTGADTGTVRVWTFDRQGEPVILRHTQPVDRALLLADNRVVSVAGRQLREFSADFTSPQSTAALGHAATALAAMHGRSRVVAGLEDGGLMIGSGTPLSWTSMKTRLPGRITRLVASENHVLAVAGRRVGIIDLPDERAARQVDVEGTADVFTVDLHKDGREFVVAHEDGLVSRYLPGVAQRLAAADGHTVYDVAYSPDGRRVLTCSQNGQAILHTLGDTITARPVALPSDGEWIETCEFSPDGRRILLTASSGRAWLTDGDGGSLRPLRRNNGLAHIGSILTIGFSSDASRVLLTGGVDGQATVWDATTGTLLSVLSGHQGTITAGEISPDGTRFLTASHDATVRLWADGWQTITQRLRERIRATLDPEKRMSGLGETEQQAWEMFRRREQELGRQGLSYGPFKYPF